MSKRNCLPDICSPWEVLQQSADLPMCEWFPHCNNRGKIKTSCANRLFSSLTNAADSHRPLIWKKSSPLTREDVFRQQPPWTQKIYYLLEVNGLHFTNSQGTRWPQLPDESQLGPSTIRPILDYLSATIFMPKYLEEKIESLTAAFPRRSHGLPRLLQLI